MPHSSAKLCQVCTGKGIPFSSPSFLRVNSVTTLIQCTWVNSGALFQVSYKHLTIFSWIRLSLGSKREWNMHVQDLFPSFPSWFLQLLLVWVLWLAVWEITGIMLLTYFVFRYWKSSNSDPLAWNGQEHLLQVATGSTETMCDRTAWLQICAHCDPSLAVNCL